MKDVAKSAGVSVATVSYVINNNSRESIPEDTKKRVMDAITELNYIPDLAARALTRKKSGLIGIFIMSMQEESLPWKKNFYAEFIDELIKALYDIGYHVIVEHLNPAKGKLDIIYERALDGAFLLDINEQFIYSTTNIFKVPIILIDSYVEDTLFHKVLADYDLALHESKNILKEDDPFIVLDSMTNKTLIDKLCKLNGFKEDNIFVADNITNLFNFLDSNKQRKGIIFNEFLAILAQDYLSPEQVVVICSSGNEYLLTNYKYKLSFNNKEKAAMAANIIVDYINKHYYSDKFSFVKPSFVK